jgi:hypothetical protein
MLTSSDSLKLIIFALHSTLKKFDALETVIWRLVNFVRNEYVVQSFYPNLNILLKTGNMRQHLSKLECLALLAGCLCHDVDHRGTNNAFQAKYEFTFSVIVSEF